MSSEWNHAQCAKCWNAANGNRVPVKLIGGEANVCCYCGADTSDGIFVRDDPKAVQCRGMHDRCPRCKQTIDPDVCHCGEEHKDRPTDHIFVPMGCECGRGG